MDLALIKTFVEVSDTGSFLAASERLFVTQSAVSLRVQRLEGLVGQTLFNRSKVGAELTPAGREFASYANTLLRTWGQALQRAAIPAGFAGSLTIGAEVGLWDSLGMDFIAALRRVLPDLALRAEVGLPQTLTQAMTDDSMQLSLTYAPEFRPGLSVEPVMEDALVLVAAWPDADLDSVVGRYALVDWGPEFLGFHNRVLPGLATPGLTLNIGSLAAQVLIGQGLAGYLPAMIAAPHLARGVLHPVRDAEPFVQRVWSVWRDDLDPDRAALARGILRDLAENYQTTAGNVKILS